MSKENAYAGKIKNAGTQRVEAPYKTENGSKGTQKLTGNDLRTKKTGK